jgi:hypothetical protein
MLLILIANTAVGKTVATSPAACVAGPHSGTLTVSQQWCASDSPHQISADVTVPNGITLTIEPATTVHGASTTELLVEGQLVALGTATQPILFTSQTDSGTGQWSGMAIDSGTAHLRYVTVRYAGQRLSVNDGLFGDPYHRSAITVSDGELELENVTLSDVVTDAYDHAMIIADSQVTIHDSSNSQFRNEVMKWAACGKVRNSHQERINVKTTTPQQNHGAVANNLARLA